VVVFIGWWFFIHRTINEKEGATRTAELVQKQRDARELSERRQSGAVKADSSAMSQEKAEKPAQAAAGETGGTAPGQESLPSAQQQAPPAGPAGQQTERTEPPAQAEAEQKPATVTPAPAGSHFSVHVASFRDTEHAGLETDYLEKHGYVTSILEAEVRGQTWYRVYAGQYRTKEEAVQARMALLALPRIGYAQIVTLKDE